MQVGNWMRDKETGGAVKITVIGAAMIEYDRNGEDGLVAVAKLGDHFDLLDDPSERDDIEFLLRAKIEANEVETGLYDLGVSYVVADRVIVEGKEVVTFQWFDHMMPFSDLLNV